MFRGRKNPPPPPEGPRPGRKRRPRSHRRRWLYVFALIGVAAVLFLLIKYLLIPLLVAVA